MNMVAHGQPFAPSTTNREYVDSTTISIVDTVLTITKEASEVFKDVPYINAFAGILIQIINIRKEIQTEKDRSEELIDKILRRSKVILDGLLRVGSSPNRDKLSDMQGKLNDYSDLLGTIFTVLNTHASKNKFDRFVNRKSRLANLEKYDRLINDFNTDFVTDLHIQSHLASQLTSLPSDASDMVYYNPVIPPPSEFMIGRDKEKSEVLDTLLQKSGARIAILGPGGMGKTTLALSALHDPAVIEQFPSRYFVSCEAVTSTSALVGEIANALRIPPAKRDEHLIDVVLSSFQGNSLLCLDNFETIWDNQPARSALEGFLAHLNHLPHLAIIVTMRGTQRPSRVSWSKPLLPPLEKLNDANSRRIFEATGGKVDIFVEKLLSAIDGIPLAITLVSAILQEGNENSESLCARWEKTRTAVVEIGGNDRLSNLDTSIHLSVYGPRMLADPKTISILAMLSTLPDGFGFPNSVNGSAIDDLQRHLPEDAHLREAILTMRRVSLLQLDVEANRLRMLAPIRRFCERRLQAPEILRNGLTAFYTEMVNNFPEVTDSAGHAIIPAELGNMHAVFVETCNRHRVDHAVVRACIGYTKWSLCIGNPVEEVMCSAMEGVLELPGLLADCHFALSDVYVRRSKLDEAQASCEHAVQLHRQVHDVLGEAEDVQRLGDIYLRRDKLDEAQASFERAFELHRQAHDVIGEADDVLRLGVVHFRRDKLDEAQASLERALELHRQTHNVLGEASDIQRLGDVHFRRDELDEAQASFEHAVMLHRQAHHVLGEADDVRRLGDVHFQRDKLDEAQASFERALELHSKAHDVLGEAYDVRRLGDVHSRRDKLDEAQASFERALELHRQSHSVIGEANDIRRLGDVHFRRDKFDEALASFEQAVRLHRQAHDILGEAEDVHKFGNVHFQHIKLDEARESFEQALALFQQAHSIFGEAGICLSLGRLYLQQDNEKEAELYLNRALLLYQQAQSPDETAALQLLQQLSVRKQQLSQA